MVYRDATSDERYDHMNMVGSDAVKMRLTVPVEPCEHGNYDEHQYPIYHNGNTPTPTVKFYVKCEGAGIGEDN